MKQHLNSIISYIIKILVSVFIAGSLIIFFNIYVNYLVKFIDDNYIPKTPEELIQKTIENRLLWNKSGLCYFAEPTKSNLILIRVPDCDKQS